MKGMQRFCICLLNENLNICGVAAVAQINLKESNKQYNLGKKLSDHELACVCGFYNYLTLQRSTQITAEIKT